MVEVWAVEAVWAAAPTCAGVVTSALVCAVPAPAAAVTVPGALCVVASAGVAGVVAPAVAEVAAVALWACRPRPVW